MPITKSAKKALRQSLKRKLSNAARLAEIKTAYRKAVSTNLSQVVSKIDKAVKIKIISPQRANRLKSRLYKKLKVVQPSPRKKPLTAETAKRKTDKKTKPKARRVKL